MTFMKRNRSQVIRSATLLAGLACGMLGAAPGSLAQTTQPATRPATTSAAGGQPVLHPSSRSAERIEVNVGESRTLDAPWPVKRVSVANPDIADVDASSPTRIQFQGKAVGVTELMIEGEHGDIWRARLDVNADTSRLEGQLRKLFANSSLEVSQMDDVVVVKGTLSRAEDSAQLRQLLTLSKMDYLDLTGVAGLQQVQLQVKVAEVSRTAIRMLGVNAFYGGNRWFGGLQLGSSAGPFIPMNVGLPQGVPVSPVPAAAYQTNSTGIIAQPSTTLFAGFPGSDLQIFLQALAENQYLRVLAEPTLVARSGQEAQFLVGGEFPIPVAELEGNTTQIAVEYKEFGVQLRFTPTVLGDGKIELRVRPEISQLSDVGGLQVLGTRVPSILTRRVETTLELQTGQTFAIAGLINQTDSARVSKVPGLGDVPVLGPLFRSVRYSRDDTEMVVLVTASLVEPSSNDLHPPVPGAFHVTPNDWELYIEGRTEGRTTVRLAPTQKERLRKLGLDKLEGPGAWASYDSMPNNLAAQHASATRKK